MREEPMDHIKMEEGDMGSITEADLNSLIVPVEPYLENRIQEFGADGEEVFVQTATLGEKLSELAEKINYKFVISSDKGDKEDSGPQQHPWSEVLKHLKTSYDEVCVLSDLMSLLQQRHYLMLDPVQQTKAPYNTSAVIVSKKQGLKAAAAILRTGVDNLKKGDVGGFHTALSHLNSRFKIRKQGSYTLGDGTYRSCGSKYFDEGLFEVMRNDEESPAAYPLKVELDATVQMLSHVTVSHDRNAPKRPFHTPSYWKHLPFSHTQVLGVLSTLFAKEMFYLLSLECLTITQFTRLMCKTVGNDINIKLSDGKELFVTKHIGPALTREQVNTPTKPLNICELCLQHHLHKGHKQAFNEDSQTDSYQHSTMMIGIVNNKPRQHLLLDFEILLVQHRLKHAEVLQRLDKIASTVKDPNISIHLGPCSTPHQSSINLILLRNSKIIPSTKVSLRVSIGSKGVLQLDSSHYGPLYCGPSVDYLIKAFKRQVQSYLTLMLKSTCTHNLWSLLSTESYQSTDTLHVQSPNKTHNLTFVVDSELNIACSFNDTDIDWKRIPGRNITHKITMLLNVICEPVNLSKT